MPATMLRVAEHTNKSINERIRIRTECNVAHYVFASKQEIDDRIRKLEQEWDIERSLETNAALVSLAGLALGATVGKKWLILPIVVSGCLLQFALQGWCPPLPLLRRLGIRTAAEIDAERYALKVLRGDFAEVGSQEQKETLSIVRAVTK
jgi:hypothetical protein